MYMLQAPSAWRRLAAVIYESLLLVSVLFFFGLFFTVFTRDSAVLSGRHAYQIFLFFIVGTYFVWFWVRGGQTLAMKTWKIKLVDYQGKPVSWFQAWLRYILSWLAVFPSAVLIWSIEAENISMMVSMIIFGYCAYVALIFILPGKQYLHDIFSKTRLVNA
jgi:uncharacterized RDD family membrane protein YckC